MSMLDLGALSFFDTPDVNGALVLTTATGLTGAQLLGTAGTLSITPSGSNFILDVVDNPVFTGTAGFVMPVGTTAQRPGAPVAGLERMNTTVGFPEVYNGSYWVPHGRVLQVVSGSIPVGTGTTGSTAQPLTTKPVNTSAAAGGFAVWTAPAFTPLSATSRIIINMVFNVATSVGNPRLFIASVFAGNTNIGATAAVTADLSAVTVTVASQPMQMGVQLVYSPGSTAAIVFSCWLNSTTASTPATINQLTATNNFGGALVTQYTIMEVA